jgi:hypothetical protein
LCAHPFPELSHPLHPLLNSSVRRRSAPPPAPARERRPGASERKGTAEYILRPRQAEPPRATQKGRHTRHITTGPRPCTPCANRCTRGTARGRTDAAHACVLREGARCARALTCTTLTSSLSPPPPPPPPPLATVAAAAAAIRGRRRRSCVALPKRSIETPGATCQKKKDGSSDQLERAWHASKGHKAKELTHGVHRACAQLACSTRDAFGARVRAR